MIILENVNEVNYNKYEHICAFMLMFLCVDIYLLFYVIREFYWILEKNEI